MNRLIARIDKAIVRGYRFVNDLHYYWWTKRHSLRRAIELARDTIYP